MTAPGVPGDALAGVIAVCDAMEHETEYGTMPGVRMRTREHWAKRVRAAALGQAIKADNDEVDRQDYRAHLAATGGAERGLRAAVEAVLPDECWVTRTELSCTALVGGTFLNGGVWVEEMCCVPCRVRAALDAAPTAEDTP